MAVGISIGVHMPAARVVGPKDSAAVTDQSEGSGARLLVEEGIYKAARRDVDSERNRCCRQTPDSRNAAEGASATENTCCSNPTSVTAESPASVAVAARQ